jgi:hypothetical protein
MGLLKLADKILRQSLKKPVPRHFPILENQAIKVSKIFWRLRKIVPQSYQVITDYAKQKLNHTASHVVPDTTKVKDHDGSGRIKVKCALFKEMPLK